MCFKHMPRPARKESSSSRMRSKKRDELDSLHQEQSAVVQSQSRRIRDLERTVSSTKALMAAHAERGKEYQSLREQWEVLATAALARDAALAKAQEEVRRLNSTNQQLSVTSADSAERLAAVTADRDMRLKSAQNMYNVQKDKTTRTAKERDYYKTELDTLRALVTTEQAASAAEHKALIERYEAELRTAARQLNDLDGRLAFELEQRRAARLETARLRLTMIEKENATS